MHFNQKYFSFPPHLSTAWEYVAALSLNPSHRIVFHLINRESVTLPPLSESETEAIFKAHAEFLQMQIPRDVSQKIASPPRIDERESVYRFMLGAKDGMSMALQHNPAQSQAPDLPQEMLAKIAQISKILFLDETKSYEEAEPHCNCYHCQIARAIHQNLTPLTEHSAEIVTEEQISEKDLQFEQWEITQTGDKLFNVVNKIDRQEQYSVYLGHPIGCTCGKPRCEHVLVVLKS